MIERLGAYGRPSNGKEPFRYPSRFMPGSGTETPPPAASLDERLAALDVTLFDAVESQTTLADRRSLLALHVACRDVLGRFSYLEIGSHLGGSLQVLIADPRCRAITSIDSRPPSQPDPYWGVYEYPDNRTERMLECLQRIPDVDLGKLTTVEASTEHLTPGAIDSGVDLCLIDGEHTNPAASRDAEFCCALLAGQGAIVFHDANLVGGAIGGFLTSLRRRRVRFLAYPLPDLLFVVELGETKLAHCGMMRPLLSSAQSRAWTAITARRGLRRAAPSMLWAHAQRVSTRQRRERERRAPRP